MWTGVYFVPAFAGLYAPHWRGDARGVIAGLTAFNTKVLVRVFVSKEVCIGAGCGHTQQ
jgi:glycerol kinase